MKLIFLGAPGAGKGTQAQILSEALCIPRLSTGDILRKEIADSTNLGLKIQKIMDSGDLVSDDIMIQLVEKRVSQSDTKNGFIIDGFPRTLPQAEALQPILEGLTHIDGETYVINLSVRESELIKRFTGRFSCANCGALYHKEYKKPEVQGVCDKCSATDFIIRNDDNDESVKLRLKIYAEKTAPLIDYYNSKGMLISVMGEQEIHEITVDIMSAIKFHGDRVVM
ncbi:MAG: adenylate kinase [Alphaproteobacteria bacterium]|jgi:adenylate kinase|nr:adenylate kinase [Candidatus Jidaibacter sp.]